MTHVRTAVAAAMTLALMGSSALADSVLAPGKPAGVHQALRGSNPLVILGVAAVVAGAIGVAIAMSNNTTPPAASTGTTP